jgi:hypothetical protein
MISWLHFQLLHDGFEFFAIVFSVGTEHRKITKESNVINFVDIVWIHTSQAAYTIEVIVAAPIHIAIASRTNYARVCLIKLVIGAGSGTTSAFGDEFSGTHRQAPPPMTPSCAELAVPNSAAVNVPVTVSLLPAPT